jgi:hypothetical protein
MNTDPAFTIDGSEHAAGRDDVRIERHGLNAGTRDNTGANGKQDKELPQFPCLLFVSNFFHCLGFASDLYPAMLLLGVFPLPRITRTCSIAYTRLLRSWSERIHRHG